VNRVITALIAEPAQLLKDPNERQSLARRLAVILQKQGIKPFAPRRDFRLGLDVASIVELCRLRPNDLPNHSSRNTQIAADRLDRHLSRKIFWRSSPQPASRTRPPKESGGLCGPLSPGSRLDADHPENGVLIPCRFTAIWSLAISQKSGSRNSLKRSRRWRTRHLRSLRTHTDEPAIVEASGTEPFKGDGGVVVALRLVGGLLKSPALAGIIDQGRFRPILHLPV
jgi:hypothetical protein